MAAAAPACSTPIFRRNRSSIICPRTVNRRSRRLRLPVGPGRLRQVLHLLRGALYARRGILAPRDADRRGGAGAWWPPARARSLCSARTSMPITAKRLDWVRVGAGPADAASGRPRRWLAAHPLHHLASARHGRRSDRRPCRRAAADAVPASAGAVRLRPRAGGDEPPAHGAAVLRDRRAPARRAAGHGACRRISSSASRARARRISPPP